jgi:hypothetical protein
MVVYRTSETQINIGAFVTDPSKEGALYPGAAWIREASHEELLATFSGFEDEVQQILKVCSSHISMDLTQYTSS